MKQIFLVGTLVFIGCSDGGSDVQDISDAGSESDVGIAADSSPESDMGVDMDSEPLEPFREKIECKAEIDMNGHADGEFDLVSYSEYDELGQLIHEHNHFTRGEYLRMDYTWENGTIVGQVLYDNGVPTLSTSISYDEERRMVLFEQSRSGQLEKRVRFENNGLEQTSFQDDNGDGVVDYETFMVMVKPNKYPEPYEFTLYERRQLNGFVFDRTARTYDDQGRLLTSFITTPNYAILTSLTYETGLTTAEIDRGNDGSVEETETWTYGEFGVLEYRHETTDGTLLTHVNYKYSEDGLVQTVEIDNDGNGELDQLQVLTSGLGSCPEPPEL